MPKVSKRKQMRQLRAEQFRRQLIELRIYPTQVEQEAAAREMEFLLRTTKDLIYRLGPADLAAVKTVAMRLCGD